MEKSRRCGPPPAQPCAQRRENVKYKALQLDSVRFSGLDLFSSVGVEVLDLLFSDVVLQAAFNRWDTELEEVQCVKMVNDISGIYSTALHREYRRGFGGPSNSEISLYSTTLYWPLRLQMTPTGSSHEALGTTLVPHSAFWTTEYPMNMGSATLTRQLSTLAMNAHNQHRLVAKPPENYHFSPESLIDATDSVEGRWPPWISSSRRILPSKSKQGKVPWLKNKYVFSLGAKVLVFLRSQACSSFISGVGYH